MTAFVGKFRKTNAGLTASTYVGGRFLTDDVVITRNIPEFLDELTKLYPDEIRVWLTRLEAQKIYPKKQDVVHVDAPKIVRAWDFDSRRRGGRGHHVTLDSNGRYNCTCEAADFGKECWAIKASRGDPQ